ncbi:hypothetical protein OHA91_38335 [Streptomyces erythrochromogenes]|uniref:Uncharacterized protein n=1 Tax=Streptomyces erythrochromogenes TaxID=285574 RepID=A0ABZ1QMD6_9ACTN|nr:hypothetical protein [Streptomyces erythrochromogenes]
MNDPTSTTALDSEALRAVIEAAIANYLDDAAATDTAGLAAHVTAAVERLLAAGPPAQPAPEGDEI